MILPSKHVPLGRTLLGVGAEILSLLTVPSTIGGIWDRVRSHRSDAPIEYDWFILAMDLLYAMGAVRMERGLLRREEP
jgi:hypothetical protein